MQITEELGRTVNKYWMDFMFLLDEAMVMEESNKGVLPDDDIENIDVEGQVLFSDDMYFRRVSLYFFSSVKTKYGISVPIYMQSEFIDRCIQMNTEVLGRIGELQNKAAREKDKALNQFVRVFQEHRDEIVDDVLQMAIQIQNRDDTPFKGEEMFDIEGVDDEIEGGST